MAMMLWLCKLTFFFLFISFFIQPVTCTETEALSTDSAVSYSDYCSSSVPESTPYYHYSPAYSFFGPFRQYETGYYYSGGNRILNSNITRFSNSFIFRTRLVYRTYRDGLFKIESSMVFQSPYYVGNMAYGPGISSRSPLNLKLQGFWSESSGKLCMVGRGFVYSKEGKLLTPAAVLKLSNLKNINNITSLITGTLVSVSFSSDKDYFEPVSLLMIPQLHYNYTLVSEDFVDGFSGKSDNVQGLPYNVQPRRGFCSIISTAGNVFNLQYTSSCSPGKNCLPFDGVLGYLPSSISLRRLEYCSEVKRKVRLLIEFRNVNYVGFYHPFNPNSTLIGEGFWDDKKNRLCVFVCRILDTAESWSNARVGDCTTRLTLRFPGVLSLRKTSSIVGQFWTNKSVNDSGYFNTIVFQSAENQMEGVPGLKYEYTEMEKVKKSCPRKKPATRKVESYPTGHNSIDMKFDMFVKTSEGKTGWGFAVPFSVGGQLYKQALYLMGVPPSSRPVRTVLDGPVNISYEIGITIRPVPEVDGGGVLFNITKEKVDITAEGIYDADTGALCMVGCRKIRSKDQLSQNASVDCEILLNFQFPPLISNKYGGYIKGSIESTRKESDPLYFNRLHVSSAAYSVEQARQSTRTMDLEITMVLISNTLVCVFVGLQLYHVKKNLEVLSFISLVMLVILTFGYMIPLVLNFEALFSKQQGQITSLVHSTGWLELNEAIVRITTMVAFLLQFRLLQLALSARSENQTGVWFAEKMTLLVTVLLYAAGAFILMLVNWGKHSPKVVKQQKQVMLLPSHQVEYQQYSTWKDLKCYAGLVLDGFLLPQILLNNFSNTRENTLSCSFYVGTTFIRLLPHVYDLYNNHSYIQQKGMHLFASEDFFSNAWDLCIALGVLLFAAIIYLQQRFGGRCILPGRFRELKAYEKVPAIVTVSSAEIVVEVSSESEPEVSYSDYCSSVVPESITNSKTDTESFGPFDTGYYIGGNRILDPKITRISNLLSFETRYVYQTNADGVSKITGSLTLYRSYYLRSSFNLKLHGFWSESSGKLCMVGIGSAYSKEGDPFPLSAVFKLSNLKNSSNITTLITGTLESLSSSDEVNYFEPISLIMFPRLNYEYTFDSRESLEEFSAESDTEQNFPFNAPPVRRFCSIISTIGSVFKLQYSSDCNSRKKNCLPLGALIGYLPRVLSIKNIRCSGVQKRIEVLVEFRNNSHVDVGNYISFNPNTTLIGEGMWDDKKNQLFVFVCQFLDTGESWSSARVGDCTTRLSLRFPAILSIRETSSVMGKIWTKKTVNDSGYFDRIVFQRTENHMEGVPGLKYEFTEFDRVKNLCLRKEQVRKTGEYPNGHSADMKFDMLVKSSGIKYGQGLAVPLAIGDQFYRQYLYPVAHRSSMFERAVPANWIQSRPINVSYEVSITLQTPINLNRRVYSSYPIEEKLEITAEGVYDSQTGNLCMVGCRKFRSDNEVFQNAFVDCEILLNFQLAPLELNKNGGYIKGSITSMRKKSDPLYFDRLDVSSAAYKTDQGRSLIWTMNLDIAMVLISNTLVCIFVGLQLYHVKKNPEVLSFISLVMLVILTLGHMIPLVLDFEALCPNKQDQDKVLFHISGWFKLNEVIVTVVMVVAFLLLLRLLQLTVSARFHDGNQKHLWFAEEMTSLVIALLYAAGAKITLLVAWEKYRPQLLLLHSSPVDYQHHPICNDLKSYAGLLLDGFLLPQILLNIVSNSKQNALSCSFYIGTTFVRLLPHAYDLYRNHSYVLYNILQFSVNLDKGFFSAACDVIIVLVLLLLAAIVYFQQQFVGHSILPHGFRGLEAYPEKGPLLSKSSRPVKPSA
ncbi:Protein of unknown function DUF2921 - like 4 [Theobroma cacao]|nr:Protein of unknown function DUF2921 - like 4 [Theobroma cacao]